MQKRKENTVAVSYSSNIQVAVDIHLFLPSLPLLIVTDTHTYSLRAL